MAEHPAFRATLTTIQRLFDRLDEEGVREQIGFLVQDTGQYETVPRAGGIDVETSPTNQQHNFL
ncbi:hypothetical protein ACOALA_17085 [Alicyclobacillus acidoterrestris]|uniref:hypothetical protein n=1 Tax=Alicyclobacillus acidoterrestris TaxID=1450 RepID=UPI003F53A645